MLGETTEVSEHAISEVTWDVRMHREDPVDFVRFDLGGIFAQKYTEARMGRLVEDKVGCARMGS